MIKEKLQYYLGASWDTTLWTIFTAVGLVPQAIQALELETVPIWLRTLGMICAFTSFIYLGVITKSTRVKGTGDQAMRT